ncbi:MAG TPA: hypothetical protein P5511_01890 [Candidatus Goldiibacteriota bacterium]|nr:hypothetical protein [Candidatus Goldiibacteriota bacterium]
MKKHIIVLLAALLFATACFAGRVNIIMKDGTLKTGELIGSDEEAYYIKTADDKAETVYRSKIKKVFEAGEGSGILTQEKSGTAPITATKKAEEISTEQQAYKVLESGERKIERDYLAKTGDSLIMWHIDIASFDFLSLGDEFKSEHGIKSGFLTTCTVGLAMMLWPLDGFATGPYLGFDLPIFTEMYNTEDFMDAAAVGYLSFVRAGWIVRWIPYNDGETLVYLDFRVGAKKSNVLWNASLYGQPLDIDTLEYRIALGIAPAVAVGWIFCPATYKAGTLGSGNIDLGGPFLSFAMAF